MSENILHDLDNVNLAIEVLKKADIEIDPILIEKQRLLEKKLKDEQFYKAFNNVKGDIERKIEALKFDSPFSMIINFDTIEEDKESMEFEILCLQFIHENMDLFKGKSLRFTLRNGKFKITQLKAKNLVKKMGKRFKAPKTSMSVRFENGLLVSGKKANQVFANVIEKIGFEIIKNDGLLRFYDSSLISRTNHNKYSTYFKNPYYILTHFNNIKKKEILQYISQKLNIPLQVTIH